MTSFRVNSITLTEAKILISFFRLIIRFYYGLYKHSANIQLNIQIKKHFRGLQTKTKTNHY